MSRFLLHDRLLVRFGSLFAFAAVIFVAAWTLSYAFLPEGLLRGKTGGAALAGDGAASSVLAEWLRLISINGLLGLVCVVAPNLLSDERGHPLGYVTVVLWAALYAVTLGTNSLSMPLPGGPLAPTLHVFARSGPYEIAAFGLAVTATSGISRWRLRGRWPRQVLEPVPPKLRPRLDGERCAGILSAALVLLAANAWEAQGIVNYVAR